MSFFDRHIDAIETTNRIVFWGSLAITAAIYLTGPLSMSTLAAPAAICVARVVRSSIKQTRGRWEKEAADRGMMRHERMRMKREIELHHEIRRLQRELTAPSEPPWTLSDLAGPRWAP